MQLFLSSVKSAWTCLGLLGRLCVPRPQAAEQCQHARRGLGFRARFFFEGLFPSCQKSESLGLGFRVSGLGLRGQALELFRWCSGLGPLRSRASGLLGRFRTQGFSAFWLLSVFRIFGGLYLNPKP